MKIQNFYDFQTIKENINSDINIGNYVMLFSGPQIWVNLYGVVKDSGKFSYSSVPEYNLRLISFLSELSQEQKQFIISQKGHDKYVISLHNMTPNKYDMWVHEQYLIKFDTEEELIKAVDDNKIKDATKKYDL